MKTESEHFALRSHGETYRIAVLYGSEVDVVSPLLTEVFGRSAFTPAWVRRKYAPERNRFRAFACVAFGENGRPASVVGALPWPIRYGGRIELAAQLADSATSPAHRGRGLHARLIHLLHDVCAAAGATCVVRLPNDLSFAITTSKLGYAHIGDLVEYQLPVRTLWAERATRRIGLGDAYHRRFERLTDPLLDPATTFPSSVLADGFAGVDRDEAFLEYKAAFGGSRVLRLAEARVWLAVRHGMLVGDMEAPSEPDLRRGLDELTGLARRLGAHRLLFQASGDIRLSRYLAKRVPETRRRHVTLFDLSSKVPSDALRLTLGDIDTF